MANEYRAVTVAGEVLHSGSPAAQVGAIGVEVLRSTTSGPTSAVVFVAGLEVLRSVAEASGRRRQMIVS